MAASLLGTAVGHASGGAGGNSTSFTVASGNNRKLIALCCAEKGTAGEAVIGSVTFGAASLTRAGGGFVVDSTSVILDVWYLDDPAVSTDTVTVTYSTAGARSAVILIGLQDAASGAPTVNTQNFTTNATSASLATTTSVADELIISGIAFVDASTATKGADQTAITQIDQATDMSLAASYYLQETAGSKTMEWTTSVAYGHAIIANTRIAPVAAGGSGSPPSLLLLGVG